MNFKEYQHVERLGNAEVEGIEFGKCYIFPKIDGSNGSVWNENGEIKCGSRRRVLSLDNDNQGFMAYILANINICKFLKENSDLMLYGEWLVPHALRTYKKEAWRKFYVFDVFSIEKGYINYDEYSKLLDKYNIEYIPPLCIIESPQEENFNKAIEDNIYLIDENSGIGEGIVIKNYEYRNKYGRVTWAKIVTNEFKNKHRKAIPNELKAKNDIEQRIVEECLSNSIVEKVLANITNENDGFHSKDIPRLLNTVYHDFVIEEIWGILKKFKHPRINFKKLQSFVYMKTKEIAKI